MSATLTEFPAPPVVYRLLEVGEITCHGDLGWLIWDRGNKQEWCELRAGHLINARIERKGRTCRRIATTSK